MQDFRLYLILDAQVIISKDIVRIAEEAIFSGGVDIFQLRAKGWPDRQIVQIGRILNGLAHKNKVLFIVNDRADLARTIGADGVHLGQDDLSVEDARAIMGRDKIIGISTHNISQVQQAQKAAPDYIAIGPIFPTATKLKTNALTPQILTQLKDKLRLPAIAIGGINLHNLNQILDAGFERVAVSRAILETADIHDTVIKFRQRLYANDAIRTG